MWFLDAISGKLKHFVKWDVSPGNVRSYGFVRVRRSRQGRNAKIFCASPTFPSITRYCSTATARWRKRGITPGPKVFVDGKVVTVWADPPYADVDGDGKLEIVLSMFNFPGRRGLAAPRV